jgi:hypothetical protein
MDDNEFTRAVAFIKNNVVQFTDDQLRHVMDVCEVELVNRMAAAAGHNDPDEHTPN